MEIEMGFEIHQVIENLIDLGLGDEANLFDTLDAEKMGVAD